MRRSLLYKRNIAKETLQGSLEVLLGCVKTMKGYVRLERRIWQQGKLMTKQGQALLTLV